MRIATWGAVAAVLVAVTGCADDADTATPAAIDPPTLATAAPVADGPTTTAAPVPDDPAPADDVSADGLRLFAIPADPIELSGPSSLAFAENEFFFEDAPGIVYIAAEGGGLDVTSIRPSYDEPISTTASVGSRRVVLPDDAVSDWTGLDDFFEVSLLDASGNLVDETVTGFCPEIGGRIRVNPDGPVESFGIDGCGLHEFGVGTRWTLDEGWAVSTFPDLGALTAPPGDYTLRFAISDGYTDLFLGPTEVDLAVTVSEPDPASLLSGSDMDADGIDDALDDDMDGDGVPDVDDPLISNDPLDLVDSDADGIVDGLDDAVDVDGDGLDDRYGEPIFPGGLDGEFADDAIDEAETEPEHEPRRGPDANPPVGALPDLRSVPAFGIDAFADAESGLDLLSFAAITWNAGPAPMVVDGFPREGEPGVMDAYQQFLDAPGLSAPSALIGTLEYHAGGGHDHWHFTDFARYDLVTEDGRQVQRSGKESWCLADTDPIDLRSRAARAVVARSLESSCGDRDARWVRETLAVGWGDQYDQSRAGQAFDIGDIPNGRYLIRITANPDGSIYEVDDRNNVADRLVILGGTPGNRTVEVPPVGLIDTESGEEF